MTEKAIEQKLRKLLKKIYDNKDFVEGVLYLLPDAEDREAVIENIKLKPVKRYEEVLTLALELRAWHISELRDFENFIRRRFQLTLQDIDELTDAEFESLYAKALALAEELDSEDSPEAEVEAEFAADFVDYLYSMCEEEQE